MGHYAHMNASLIHGLKCWSLAGLLGLSSFLCYAETPAGITDRNTYDSFDQLISEYNEYIATESNALQTREDRFFQNYRQRLEGFKGKYLQDGNLDGYVEAKKLLENFDRQRKIETGAKQKGLAEYIQESLDTVASLKADHQKLLLAIRTAYINKCIILKREFTRKEKIEDAISVSRFLDKLNSETQQEQNSIARNELIKLFDNVTSPDASILVEVFKKNVRESSLAETSFKYTSSELRDDYRRRLELLDQRYQAAENIDGLLALNKELARHNNFGELGETDIVTSPSELQSLQQNYFKALSEATRKLKVDLQNADKLLLASLYKAMSTDAYREDDLFKQAVDTAIEEFKNLKVDTADSDNLESAFQKASPLWEGLVAYYPFNGNANDESGNGHHGIVNGAMPSQDRYRNGSSAYSFNGATDFIRANIASEIFSKDFALSIWFNAQSIDDFYPHLVYGSPYFLAWSLCGPEPSYISNDLHRRLGFYLQAPNGLPSARMGYIFSRQYIETNRWHHGCIVRSNLHFSMFIDGVLSDSPSAYGLAGNFIQFGNALNTADGSFHGSLDDIRIYNRALSESEVKQLYSMKDDGE